MSKRYICIFTHTQISDVYTYVHTPNASANPHTQGCVYLLFTHNILNTQRGAHTIHTYSHHIYPQINMHACAHMYTHHT